MNSAPQLALKVQLRDGFSLDNFCFAAGGQVLQNALQQQLGERGEQLIFLHGPADSGRSHLLQACCIRAPESRSMYLPLAELRELPAQQVLSAAENLDLVCIDDVDQICGSSAWEEALFHLFNRCLASGTRMLFSASAPPGDLPLVLPDLRSRLSSALVFQLLSATDEQKIAILQLRAKSRGLELTEEVCGYILSRAPRSVSSLVSVLEQLDEESLAHQRALSIPFVKSCLGW